MKYIRIYTESKSMNSYYYEEQTGEMFILEQSKAKVGTGFLLESLLEFHL